MAPGAQSAMISVMNFCVPCSMPLAQATSGVRGVTRHHEAVASFTARQILDIFSPSNFLATNPDLLFIASYPPDTAGMIRAVHEVGIKAKLVGGSLVGV